MKTQNDNQTRRKLRRWRFQQLVSTVVGLAIVAGVTYKMEKSAREERNRFCRAIEENRVAVTNNNHVYSAYLQENVRDAGICYDPRKLTIEDRDQKGVHSRLSAMDYDKDGIIDKIDISQVPKGNPLERMTSEDVGKIYTSFKSAINTEGEIISINRPHQEIDSTSEVVRYESDKDLALKIERLKQNTTLEHQSLASKLAMQDYIPVGNGGALSEFYGKVSPERKLMYKLAEERYLRFLGSYGTQELRKMNK